MVQLKSNFKNMVLVLAGIALFAAITLSSVYTFTKAPIAASKLAKQQKAIKDVLPPGFDHLAKPDSVSDGTETLVIHKAYDAQNHFIGAAVESSANTGFNGLIQVMVGFDKNGTVVNYSVLEQKETPGLGTKMVTWFKTKKNHQDVCGKNGATTNFTVTKDGGDIDAITAATISSRAFLFTIRNAYHYFMMSKGKVTADSTKKSENN